MKNDNLELVWKALSDPTRRHILDLLRKEARTTGELSAVFTDISRYAVMKHLNTLEEAGLIFIRRKGRERFNHLNVVPLQQIYERWLQPYEAEWAQSLLNLKNLSEGDTQMTSPTAPSVTKKIEQEISVNAPVEQVYKNVLDINSWWSHRQSQLSDSMRLEAKVGGRMWETFDGTEESAVLWATVTSIRTNDHIQLSGSIGMTGAIYGNVVICTIPQDDGSTKITLNHEYLGDLPEGWHEGWVSGWGHNLGALKTFSEDGIRVKDAEAKSE